MGKLCWICRSRQADSGEHRFKASDIRERFPGLSQQTPVYMQRDGRNTNKRVGTAGADTLKFIQSVCRQCNNTGTQRYDRAWERLSRYLHANWPRIARSDRLDLSKPFPGTTRDTALDVHLFFVKQFGCKIVESETNIDLTTFSNALITRTPIQRCAFKLRMRPTMLPQLLHMTRTSITSTINIASWAALPGATESLQSVSRFTG